MDCYNSHRARTVRVAACTLRTTLGDPAANAHAVLDIARECHDECAALAAWVNPSTLNTRPPNVARTPMISQSCRRITRLLSHRRENGDATARLSDNARMI